ncbi:nonsense-mediated mRNA decay factor SMG8-like [Physella acuta]|uniref:nonsense-mediated mRNA decay factor SMG8-like n=1 Tax=Physella acuta TaxID=109671 RepID=UPI0027DCFAF4|nr:nonsense-mediated mRNA decay factor SMG8-like [Physella acuta]
MASPFDKLFGFPLQFDLSNVPNSDAKICIVSIFGKSRLNPFCSKATPLNPIVNKDIFQGSEGFIQKQIQDGNIECYYDADNRVMFLHLLSFYDTNLLVKKCEQLDQNINAQDLYKLCKDDDLQHAKSLLLLFNLSHIILLCHPSSTFDLSYLKLFHILDNIRLKVQTSIVEILATVSGVSKDWANFGRVCTPRMLFVFETPAIDVQPEDLDSNSLKASKKYPPLKKLQMSIEDMIFRILRKTRAITNISNNSLFSVPINQPYVYLCAKKNEVSDPVDFIQALMRQNCCPTQEDTQTANQKPKPYSCSRRKLNAMVPDPLPLSAPSNFPPSTLSSSAAKFPLVTSGSRNQDQSFKEFLWQHIEMVFSKTINDNVGRHGIDPIFELPTLGVWLLAANKLHKYILTEASDTTPGQPFTILKNMLDVSMRFSENRCNKVLPMAENAYQQDLPPFYITSYHQSRVNKVKRLFAQYARGPAYEKYLMELEASCERYWKAGRQQCEALSLTGNLCTNKIHRTPTEKPSGPEDKRAVSEHSSQIKTKAACNCGRLQADKDDPFNHKSANYEFYQSLETSCCSRLEHIALPVFSSTTSDVPRAASIPSSPEQPETQVLAQDNTAKDTEKTDAFSTLSELSLALSLGQYAPTGPEPEPKVSQVEDLREETQPQEADLQLDEEAELKLSNLISTEEQTSKAKTMPNRQHSTTEYLPYMIHTKSPVGLLPMFSSFSLCKLGSSSSYAHMIGLELPGFLPGSNFLLPWDIPVKSEVDKWPSVSETFGGGKKRQLRKISKPVIETVETVSVRVYLGMEYECPRGHRFFCSGPDKVIKVSSNSIVKDNASRLVQMDMPLYTACHCKQPKGCMSQMMRVYIVTPRDTSSCQPIRIQINPFIQPGPAPCPLFHPGLDTPVELPPDGVWVLRLPHIYQDEHCIYLMPNDHQQFHNCFVQKSMFNYRSL